MKTPRETIDYRGCKICIHNDEAPENPFEMWDCEPPLLTFYDRWPKAYNNAPENWSEVLALLPDSCFERGKRVEFIKTFLKCSVRDFVSYSKANRSYGIGRYFTGTAGDFREQAAEQLESELDAKPTGWGSACEWMNTAAEILNWGGIIAISQESRGYCQGDITLCLAIATPAWAEMVGAPADSHKRQMESAIKLYGYWAWGDVYGFTCEDEGEELEEIGSSVWGFYGDNHQESGLIEAAQEAIDSHLEQKAKQEAEEARKEAETISELTAAFTF